ncbi:FxDxF family PEP-CTERM protein [Sphingobium nicotianae]|uniref:PEP-CTERM sorting domain-containing protein n=1 Tax=Sphingobium nicotianae TaxID=2782607 RepID=A0A9X1DF37_9SPHN|nr:FxDxF family PEP-CTERM protein [Sphingobium nicotianae]MBT2188388.1 PEP-CTERM sorting domain-containing protein [Sphingobium nicotianae]
MKKIIWAASAAIAALSVTPAAHASVSIVCPGNSGLSFCTFNEVNMTGSFGDSFTSPQSFTDSYQINLSTAYVLSITATNTAATGGPISFTSAELLDSAMTSLGPIAFGAVPTTFNLAAGSYYLKFVGASQGSASFGGTIDVRTPAVPEPATWAMMLAGVAAVGVSLRRRARVVAFS